MKKTYRYLPALLVGIIILILTATPGKTISGAGLDNEAYHINGHFLIYALFTLTLFKAFGTLKTAFATSLVYGILMELLQLHVPRRAFQFLDIGVNSLGSVLALLVLWKRLSVLPKKLANWLEK